LAASRLSPIPRNTAISGIMTFMVSHDGTVFQKDLGPQTDQLARKIESFDPDQTWTKVNVSP
jgi:hypothetical protein